MKVLIIGAAGMLGRKLAERIARQGTLDGSHLEKLTLVDVIPPEPPRSGFDGEVVLRAVDVASDHEVRPLISDRPDVIVHLAAIVSGEAEADFEKGYRINLDGSRNLFEAIRVEGLARGPYRPRVVFSSSLAAFGPPLPSRIDDDFLQAPSTSYGTQKVIGELLLADYTRRGFLDGIGLRLPTISVRPGKPNKAASGFFSSILRDPLIGQEAVLPVPESVRHWFASPRSAVGFLMHAATMELAEVGPRRTLNMPGVSATVGDQISALRRVAGDGAVALIKRVEDPAVLRIVEGWPKDFDARRAQALGFKAEASVDEIIRVHIEDELGGTIGA